MGLGKGGGQAEIAPPHARDGVREDGVREHARAVGVYLSGVAQYGCMRGDAGAVEAG